MWRAMVMCDVRKVTARAAADFVLLCAVICMTACVNGNDTYTGSGAPRTYKAFVQALDEAEGGESPGNPADIAFAGTEDASEIYRALSGAGKYVRLDLSESTVTGFGTGQYLSGQAKIVSLILPYNLEQIVYGAFIGLTQLEEVFIPYSVTKIGEQAFRNCTSLALVTILDSVRTIGNGAFRDCSSLSEIMLPRFATIIGEYAFNGCVSLTEITIPESVEHIGGNAFSSCSNLNTVIFEGSHTVLADHTVFTDGSTFRVAATGDSGTGSYVVAEGTYLYDGTKWRNA